MKLLLIMFACLCLQKPDPEKKEKKDAKPKKETKKTYNKMAPSIIIINY